MGRVTLWGGWRWVRHTDFLQGDTLILIHKYVSLLRTIRYVRHITSHRFKNWRHKMYVVPTAIIGKGPSVAVHGVSVYCNRQGRFKSSVLLHRVSRHIAADVSKDRCAFMKQLYSDCLTLQIKTTGAFMSVRLPVCFSTCKNFTITKLSWNLILWNSTKIC